MHTHKRTRICIHHSHADFVHIKGARVPEVMRELAAMEFSDEVYFIFSFHA